MEKDLLRLLQACVGVVVLLGTALLVFGLFPCMKSEVGAAWVQAIGSIAALGAVVWTVTTQEAYRKRDARSKGLAIAAAMTFRVTKAAGDLEQLRTTIGRAEKLDCDPVLFQSVLEALQGLPQWSTEDLTHLAALENFISFKLAGAIDRVHSLTKILKDLVQTSDLHNDPAHRKYMAHVIGFHVWEIQALYALAGKRMNQLTFGLTSPFE